MTLASEVQVAESARGTRGPWALLSSRAAPPTTDAMRSGLTAKRLHLALRFASLGLALGAWQVVSSRHLDLGIVNFANVPAPTEVLRAGAELLGSPKLLEHVRSSVARVFGGFAAAGLVGIAIGLLVGRSRLAADALLPSLEVLRPIPGVAWIPLAILMFPSSELSMVFITFMGALFQILLNTIHGVEALDRRLISSAQCLGANRLQIFREVVLPGALPSIITGLSIGMGTSWFCLVTAEMIAGQYGIGYYTWESYNLQRYPEIVVGMLLIGVFGMASSALVKRVGAALTPWYRTGGGANRVG
jgi:NitT/TauT family transport system permease protein